MASLIFIIIQILFLPLTIIGASLVAYKQLATSRKLGISATAVEIINGRWAMDVFGIRKDEPTVKLNRVLPNNSVMGMWFALLPLYLRYRITGKNWLYPTVSKQGDEGLAHLVTVRTLYFDEVITKAKGNIHQFVVMGAGFDTRCYGTLIDSGVACFELDQTNTQQLKIKLLKKAGIDARHVQFAEVDFATENWYEKLAATGYDPTKRTLFLWEGVTLYLSERDVRNTLQDMKANSAAGSIVVADFYALGFVTGDLFPSMKSSLQVLKITDEKFGFGLDFARDHASSLATFVECEGWQMGDTYFMGEKTQKGAWMVVAELTT
ncbi:MAG: SAM-dependent methyltransferase [Chloroflexota bacterium]